jgi:hypothetical protein
MISHQPFVHFKPLQIIHILHNIKWIKKLDEREIPNSLADNSHHPQYQMELDEQITHPPQYQMDQKHDEGEIPNPCGW